MHRIELDKKLDTIQLHSMGEWLKTHTDGYLGEGSLYYTDAGNLAFIPIAFIPDDEDAIVFKLTFNL